MKVFIDKKIFENIILKKELAPNWHIILCKHSEIFINLTKNELYAELIPETPIYEFINAHGLTSKIIASDESINKIKVNPELLVEYPRAVYLLDIDSDLAKQWQEKFGVIVQNYLSLDDNILSQNFARKMLRDEIIEDVVNIGWKSLIKYKFAPSNSIIISDPYVITSTEYIKGTTVFVGILNLLWMLDVMMPQKIEIPYNVTIISDDNNRNDAWKTKITEELKKDIKALRDYVVNVELVFKKSQDLHERIAILNYVNTSLEHGFTLFKSSDPRIVKMGNKVQINAAFTNIQNNHGESEYEIAAKELKVIKGICNHLSKHLNDGNKTNLGAILGDCNADFSLVNRLLNDV